MRVLLFHLDGRLPNLALARLAAHHRAMGDAVVYRRAGNMRALEPHLEAPFDRVYASLIFEKSRPLADRLLALYPRAIVGGTGWDLSTRLEDVGVETRGPVDLADWPTFRASIGFTQRGCRFKCGFCVVPRKEGKVVGEVTIAEIWRGEPWPRDLVLLDNDFFGQRSWPARIAEIVDGGYRVNFNQGINARMLTDETAAAIASIRYYNVTFARRQIYTAWDNRGDERRLFAGLEALVRHGVRPKHITVYMLIGYWPNETAQDREHRRRRLREFGAFPYPMAYRPTPELQGFQRWVIRGFDQYVPWSAWVQAKYQPRNLGKIAGTLFEPTRATEPIVGV